MLPPSGKKEKHSLRDDRKKFPPWERRHPAGTGGMVLTGANRANGENFAISPLFSPLSPVQNLLLAGYCAVSFSA
jgi:hypothetical protein